MRAMTRHSECRSKPVSVSVLALLATVLFSHAPTAASESTDRVVMRDGVKHVVNPATGTEAARVISTTELWRRGGDEDETVFGALGDIIRDRDGRTYLLDTQLSQIHVIAPDGKYVRAIGGDGEGPAEFRMASGVVLLTDSLLCVTQVMPARAVKLSTSGRAMGDHPLSRDLVTAYLNGCAVVGNRLVVKSGRMIQDTMSMGLRTTFDVLDEKGNVSTTYWERFQKADFSNMQFDEKADAEPVWAFGADGRLFVNNDWDRYVVEVVSPGKKIHYVIERAYEHLPRDKDDLEAIEKQKRSGEMPPETKVSTTVRDVVGLFPRDDGKLWVLSSRGDRETARGVVAVFDEFDRSGVFVRAMTIKGLRRPHLDAVYLIDDLVFVVTNGLEGGAAENEIAGGGEIEVVCLRLSVR